MATAQSTQPAQFSAASLMSHDVRVKNTFIEEGYLDNEIFEDETITHFAPKRQASAPATSTYHKGSFDFDAMNLQKVTELLKSDSEKDSEPEKESEPTTRYQPEFRGALSTTGQSPTMDELPVVHCDACDNHKDVKQMPNAMAACGFPQAMPGMAPNFMSGYGMMPQMLNPAMANACSILAANAMAVSQGIPTAMASNVYTVMLRNLPNKVDQESLLEELDKTGFSEAYDFLYLPIDPETSANRGYAFINFVSTAWAMKFRTQFENRKFSKFNSDKVMSTVPAALQGFDANYAHYSRARVNHRELAARPLFLRKPGFNDSDKSGGMGAMNTKQLRQQQLEVQRKAKQQCQQQYAPPHNTRSMPSTQQAINIAPMQGAKLPKFCSECGSKIRQDFKFCSHCGTQIVALQ